MKTLMPIPCVVIQEVENYITKNFPTVKATHKTKLFSVLIDLWIFINDKHNIETLKLEKSEKRIKESGKSHLNWVNISRDQLIQFNVSVNKTRFTYAKLIDILLELNLIQVNNAYEPGNFPKSYRPVADINYSALRNIEIDLKKVFKNIKSKTDLIKENKHQYLKLIEDLYLTNIDLIKFYSDIDQMVGMEYSKKTTAILTHAKIYSLKIQALKINLGLHFFSASSTGRIYSSIANLPTIMIPYLKLNNEHVIEIDAANSQPLLLSSLVSNLRFKRDVENGRFYEVMAKSMGISRNDFKMKSYRWIFFNDSQIGTTWKQHLDPVYPGLADQINEIKKDNKLWYILQKAEADIWIKIALKQAAPILTRHDSILSSANTIEGIKKQLKSEYKKQGMNVTLK